MSGAVDVERINYLTQKMGQARLLHAEILDLIAELDHDNIAHRVGYQNTRALLIDALRVAPLQATRLVAHAGLVAESLTPTGHPTPAPLPTVREALRDGLIDGDHIEVIARTLKQLPEWATVQHREVVERTLGETARTHNPQTVREHGQILLKHLDQDGSAPDDEESAQPSNSFRYRRHHDGTMKFTGHLGAEAAELLEEMLTDLGKSDGPTDPRSHDERYGDALSEVVHRAANPDGTARATRTTLVVTLDLNALMEGIGAATLESGCPLAPATVRRLACDAEVIPAVLNSESVPLDFGRAKRLVQPQQRKALVARDKRCAYPGCTMPARWADAHHIKTWKDGGTTDLDNLVLACRRHHTILHGGAWQIHPVPGGRPVFIPPKWIDPAQKPVRNIIRQ